MKFRIYNKIENYHIHDCEYLVNHKGEILFQYIDSHGGLILIPCPIQYVVQYSTGLKDVGGREIFEGDFIEWKTDGDTVYSGKVGLSPTNAAFIIDTSGRHLIGDAKYGDFCYMHREDKYKIIEKP